MSQDYNNYQNIFTFSNGLQQQQHIAQQIRRDKLRAQGATHPPPPPPPFSGNIEQDESSAAAMMSEMFSYPQYGAVSTHTELLEAQISQTYRSPRAAPPPTSSSDWVFHRQNAPADDSAPSYHHHQVPSIHSDSASAMQLFPNHPSSSSSAGGQFGQFTWLPNENSNNPSNEILGSVVEGQQEQQQRLSLSLSSSLQQMAVGGGAAGSIHGRQWSSILRASKYAKAAQELLEEFCSVGGGQFRKVKTNNNKKPAGGGGDENAAASEGRPSLSASDRVEHQRRKVKLLSMLDEVERRYNHYCEQMQMVVNSYDMVMGPGAATPYTSLAHKAMSRHFRCLKEALTAQLKQSCEALGEKDPGSWKSGATKGETPRLRILEQSLRQQQRAYQQMDQQEAWRPQRGLPDTSVNALRAWLFEHFLNPYPSDADKQILARQTGLSRNQVSNWFINARVRLWKPMVEEMYQQETNEDQDRAADRDHTTITSSSTTSTTSSTAQIPTPPPPTTTSATTSFTPPPAHIIINAHHDNDTSFPSINAHFFSENHPMIMTNTDPAAASSFPADMWRRHPTSQFRTNGGDVSLTLGLRHDAGDLPEEDNPFSVRDDDDFDGC